MAQLIDSPKHAEVLPSTSAIDTKKVIIIEDQTIMRDLICQLVNSYSAMEVVADSGDGAEGYELCLAHAPDLVILDVMLLNLNGSEVLRRLKAKNPHINILIFSAASSNSMVNRLLKSGVTGYIEKDAGLAELEKAINLVSDGRSYFSPESSMPCVNSWSVEVRMTPSNLSQHENARSCNSSQRATATKRSPQNWG